MRYQERWTHASGRHQALQTQIQRVSDALYQVGKHSSSIIKGIKCALACQGICDDFMAEPFHRFREEERARVRKVLAELGITTGNPVAPSN